MIELIVSQQCAAALLYLLLLSSAGGDIWQLQHRTLSSNEVIHVCG